MNDDIVARKDAPDYLAPDGSQIFLLVSGETGSLCECVLPPGQTSSPVQHQSVEEVWYFTEGQGEVYREGLNGNSPVTVAAGDSLRIPAKRGFQFRNTGDRPLRIVIATMPPWPGEQEASPASAFWAG